MEEEVGVSAGESGQVALVEDPVEESVGMVDPAKESLMVMNCLADPNTDLLVLGESGQVVLGEVRLG
ncbi:hypothetical protein AALP_AA4G233700 [Arabis alpina]|uniref:Uncharacterized protein n=1 Tax=Arabis alpina TaxID=50452 RepID=A0A087H551_ARAAL|nr:hypothetical protein AALP_AA4G233700 [Arabis alpina]